MTLIKTASAVAVIILALTAAITSTIPRHVDPLTVSDSVPNPVELANLYSIIANNIAYLDLTSAIGNVSTAKNIYIPKRFEGIILRVNELLEEYILSINNSKSLIDMLTTLVSRGDYKSSTTLLPEAYLSLAEARITHISLTKAVDGLRVLGVPSSEVRELANSTGTPLEVLGRYLDGLRSVVEEAISNATETELTVWVSRAEVSYGDVVEVYGRLTTTSGEPLSNQLVITHFGPKNTYVITDSEGFFKTTFIADIYIREALTYAEFMPRGEGLTYCRSNEVLVMVDFYTPNLRLTLSDEKVTPGQTTYLTISTDTYLEVYVSTKLVGDLKLDVYGEMVVPIRIPKLVDEGSYLIVARSAPRGYVGPTTNSITLEVVRLGPKFYLDIPKYVIVGFPATIKVMSDISYVLEAYTIPPTQTVVIGDEVYLNIPLSYLDPEISVVFKMMPTDPKFRSEETVFKIPTYNPISITTSLIGVGLILTITMFRGRRGRHEVLRGSGLEVVKEGGGIDDPIRKSFNELLGILSKLTGVLFEAHQTFREYVRAIEGRVSEGVRDTLSNYFMRVEGVVYGPPTTKGLKDVLADLLKELISWLRGLMP